MICVSIAVAGASSAPRPAMHSTEDGSRQAVGTSAGVGIGATGAAGAAPYSTSASSDGGGAGAVGSSSCSSRLETST